MNALLGVLALAGTSFLAYVTGYARALNDERERRRVFEWRQRMAQAR